MLAGTAVHGIGDAQAFLQRLLVLFRRPLPRDLQGGMVWEQQAEVEACKDGAASKC